MSAARRRGTRRLATSLRAVPGRRRDAVEFEAVEAERIPTRDRPRRARLGQGVQTQVESPLLYYIGRRPAVHARRVDRVRGSAGLPLAAHDAADGDGHSDQRRTVSHLLRSLLHPIVGRQPQPEHEPRIGGLLALAEHDLLDDEELRRRL